MKAPAKEMLKHFTNTADIMQAMKNMFSDELQQLTECEPDKKICYEKCERFDNAFLRKR